MKELRLYIQEVGLAIAGLWALLLLDPMGQGHFFGYLLFIIFLVLKSKTTLSLLDKNVVWILLFSFTYTLFNAMGPNKGPQYLLIQVLFPPLFYIVGKYLVKNTKKQGQIIFILALVMLVYSMTSVLSVGMSLLTEGFKVEERDVANFWNGKSVLATNMATYLIYNLVLPGLLLTNKNLKKGLLGLVLLGMYVITLLCSFRLGSRTAIAVAGLGLAFGYFQLLISQPLNHKIRTVFITALVVFAALKWAPVDMNADYLSVLGDRLNDSEASSISTAGNRTALWQDAINKLQRYPLGWQSDHYAHNTWLDIAHVGGIIPLLFFLVSNFNTLRDIKNTYSLKEGHMGLTTTFILYILITFLLLFGEPLILGNFYAIAMIYFIHGVIFQYKEQYFLPARRLTAEVTA